jgi:enoyl-CoA hydratase/carnithine racemase
VNVQQAPEGAVEATPPVFTREGHRATIRLNRPRYLNRIQPEDLTILEQHLDAIEADFSIRVLVFTGTGRAFSAGYDLGDMAEKDRTHEAEEHPAEELHFERVANRLENIRVPTVCALNGGVYGGSTDLALACDFRIGVDTAEMFMPAARLGYHFYRSGIVRYTTRLGVAAAKKLFLTAEKIDAREMLRIGYLDEVVAAGALMPRADALAATLAAMAPTAVQGMKRTINEFARGELDDAAAILRNSVSQRSEDLKEGLKAFREKRTPIFTGR